MFFDPRMAAAASLIMSSSPNNNSTNTNNSSSFCDQINVNKNNTLNNSSTFTGQFSGQQNTPKLILSPSLSIKQEETNTNSQQYFPTCSDIILQQPLPLQLLREKSPTSTSFRIDTIIGENNERKNSEINFKQEEQNKEIKNNLFYSKQFISVQNLIEQLGGGMKQQQQGQMMMLMMDKQLNSNNNFMSNEDNLINNEELCGISPCPQTSTNQKLFSSQNIRNQHSSPHSSSSETTTTPITNTMRHNGIKRNTNNNNCCVSGKKARKARTIFTDKQLQELETMFEHKRYLSVTDRMELARKMNLSDTQVKTWYQNRRTKYKRQEQTNLDMISEHQQLQILQGLVKTDPFYWSQFASNPYLMHRLLPAFLSANNLINSNNPLFNNSTSSINNNTQENEDENKNEEKETNEIVKEEESIVVKLGKRKHSKNEDNEEIVNKVAKEL